MIRFADHPRYGDKAERPNPRFLDANVFVEEVLPPYEQAFHGQIGPFIFQFLQSTSWKHQTHIFNGHTRQ